MGFHIEFLGGQPSTTVDPEHIVPPPKNFTLLIPLHLSSPILIYQRHPPMLNRAESIVTLQHPLRPNWLQHWSDPLCTAPQAQGAPSHDRKCKTHSKKNEPLLVQARAVKKEPWRSSPSSCSNVRLSGRLSVHLLWGVSGIDSDKLTSEHQT